jgi:hypothetical protein
MTSLRARQHDVHTTQISFWGQLKGTSLGAVALLSMVQAMTECTFHDQVKSNNRPHRRLCPRRLTRCGWLVQLCSTGAISLSGRVLQVDGIDHKASAAASMGQRRVVLPEGSQAEVAGLRPELRDNLDFRYVDDVTQLLKEAVIGEPTNRDTHRV